MSKILTTGTLKLNPLELRDDGTYVCEYRLMDAATNEVIIASGYDSSADTKRQITYSKINILASYLGISDHFYCKIEETVITYLQAKAITLFIIEEQKIINEHMEEKPVAHNCGGFWVTTNGKKLYFNDSSAKDDFIQKEACLFLFISSGVGHKELFREIFAGLKRIK